MDKRDVSGGPSSFDVFLSEVWPGGRYLPDSWKTDDRWFIAVEDGFSNEVFGYAAESFPSVPFAHATVILAPVLVRDVCAWFSAEYGPYVSSEPFPTSDPLYAEITDGEFIRTAFAYTRTIPPGYSADDLLADLSPLMDVVLAARATSTPFDTAVELLSSMLDRDLPTMTDVLSACTDSPLWG